jgi:adenylate cyclase
MPSEHTELAIAFADLCGSTRLFERLGDVEARRVCSLALDRLAEITRGTGGRVIKTIGDEAMCAWPVVDDAFEATSLMPRTIARDAALVPYGMSLRVGLHAGPVIMEGGDVFGDAVNVAARMAAAAKADQILTTGDTLARLSPGASGGLNNRFLERTTVRGRRQPIEIFEILWQNTADIELTVMPGMTHTVSEPRHAQLSIEHEGRVLTVSPERPSVTFGRSDGNDVVVIHELVSRNHAGISLRKGKFVLSDSSTNGTGVITDDGRRLYLHREEVTLYGSGLLALGSRDTGAGQPAVRYHIEQ